LGLAALPTRADRAVHGAGAVRHPREGEHEGQPRYVRREVLDRRERVARRATLALLAAQVDVAEPAEAAQVVVDPAAGDAEHLALNGARTLGGVIETRRLAAPRRERAQERRQQRRRACEAAAEGDLALERDARERKLGLGGERGARHVEGI